MAINAGQAVGYLDLDFSRFSNGLRTAQSQLRTFGDDSLSAGQKFTSVGQGLKTVGSTLSKAVTVPLLAAGIASTKTAVDFESAFAGVKKTVNATDEELSKLEKGIRSMAKEMPTAATEIAGVAEAAGQLGIKTPNILDFTKTMVMLGDSTNMSAEEAATSLARLANITGMSQTDFDRLGSTIVALGNNLATTESEITAMGLRLAGAGSQVGMTEAQIMSFAGALSSVGIEAEAGGSAFSKVMIDMQLSAEKGGKKLQQFASVAGMSSSEFKKAFEKDATSAILAFIKGLGDAESKGQSAIGILDKMGIREVRLRDALLRAAGASDVFSEALEIGTQAWDENTALTNEANQRYETMASKMAMLKNKLVDIGITIGNALMPFVENLVTKIGDLADWFSNLDSSTQGVILTIAGVVAAIGPALMIIGQMSIGIGALIGFFGKAKLAIAAFGTALKTNLISMLISANMFISTTIIPALTSLGTFITGTIIPALTATAVTIGTVTIPVWAVIAAIGALIAIGVLLYKNWDTVKAKCSEVWNNIKETLLSTWESVKTSTIEAWENIKTSLLNTWESIKTTTIDTWNNIINFLSQIWLNIVTAIQPFTDFVKEIISMTWNFIKDTTTSIWESIRGIIESVWNFILSIINLGAALIELAITVAWTSIKTITTTIWEGIKQVIQAVWDFLKPYISAAVNAISTGLTTAWNFIKNTAITVWTAIRDFLVNIFNNIKNTITTVWNSIKSFISNVWNNIKATTQSVWNSIKSSITSAVNSIKSVISTVFNAIKTFIQTAVNRWKSIIQTVWNAIKNVVSTGANAVKSTISRVFSTLQNILTAPFRAAQTVISNILGGITGAINKVTGGIKKVTNLFRSVDNQQLEQENIPTGYNEVDYSKVRFSYAKAKQTSISDVIAKNNSMVETLNNFKKDLEVTGKNNQNGNTNLESTYNINLNIDKMVNTDNKSIEDIADELAFYLRRKNIALGGVR